MAEQKYDLYSDFNIEQHKKHYTNYLEVIMFPDGHIEYAVPSHQEKLIKIYSNKTGLSRDEISEQCPTEYAFYPNPWLCEVTGCVSIWSNGIIKGDHQDLTDEQLQMLLLLRDEGLLIDDNEGLGM